MKSFTRAFAIFMLALILAILLTYLETLWLANARMVRFGSWGILSFVGIWAVVLTGCELPWWRQKKDRIHSWRFKIIFLISFFLLFKVVQYIWDAKFLNLYSQAKGYEYLTPLLWVISAFLLIFFFSRPLFWKRSWMNALAIQFIYLYIRIDPSGAVYQALRKLFHVVYLNSRYFLAIWQKIETLETIIGGRMIELEIGLQTGKPSQQGGDLHILLDDSMRLRRVLAEHCAPSYAGDRPSNGARLAAAVLYDTNHWWLERAKKFKLLSHLNNEDDEKAKAQYQRLKVLPEPAASFVELRCNGSYLSINQLKEFLASLRISSDPILELTTKEIVLAGCLELDRLFAFCFSEALDQLGGEHGIWAILEFGTDVLEPMAPNTLTAQYGHHHLGLAWWQYANQLPPSSEYQNIAWQNAIWHLAQGFSSLPLEKLPVSLLREAES
jgi:hypothetical protein